MLREAELQHLLLRPRRYVQRRVETFQIPTKSGFEWQVELQIRIPDDSEVGIREADTPGSLTADATIISLGLFEKRRTPELKASDGSGNQLPILTRQVRARFIASALLSKYWLVLSGLGETGHPVPVSILRAVKSLGESDGIFTASQKQALLMADILESEFAEMIASEPEHAKKLFRRWQRILANPTPRDTWFATSWRELAGKQYFDVLPGSIRGDLGGISATIIEEIEPFITQTHVLAVVQSQRDQLLNVSFSYIEDLQEDHLGRPSVERHHSSPTVPSARSTSSADSALPDNVAGSTDSLTNSRSSDVGGRKPALGRTTRLLSVLGVFPSKIERQTLNADHALSFYITPRPPKGLEVTRSYWGRATGKSNSVPPYYDVSGSNHLGTLSMHNDEQGGPFPLTGFFELRVRSSSWVRTAFAQVLSLLVLTVLVYAGAVDSGTPNLQYLFGLPAGVIGVVALVTHELEAALVIWLRRLLLVAAALSVTYVVGFAADLSVLPVVNDPRTLPIFNTFVMAFSIILLFLLTVVSWTDGGSAASREERTRTFPKSQSMVARGDAAASYEVMWSKWFIASVLFSVGLSTTLLAIDVF